MHCEGGQDHFQCLLLTELEAMRKHLNELAHEQTSLTCAMAKVDEKIGSLVGKWESVTKESNKQVNQQIDLDATEVELDPAETSHSGSVLTSAEVPETREFIRLTTPESRRNKAIDKLKNLILINDDVKKRDRDYKRKFQEASMCQKFEMLSMDRKEMLVDCLVAFIIFANAVFIGISADHWTGEINVYCFIDILFCVVFLAELVVKFHVNGCKGYFCRGDMFANTCDLVLVILDTIQLLMVFFANDLTTDMYEAGVPVASLFRTVRLLRIARILRLLRYPAFDDLLAMIEGLVGGASTLAWAIALFVLIIYVAALLCQSLLGGSEQHTKLQPYFASVSRSMYTVFRCSFGDCTTSGGLPIPEFISDYHGVAFSLGYSLFLFVMTIGLFNVICAIFVDATMTRAAELELSKKLSRILNEKLWATCVITVVRRCLVESGKVSSEITQNDHIDADMLEGDIDCSVVQYLCNHDEEVLGALNDLDIDPHDHDKLAEILDPDHSGSISFEELVNGLHQLRGQPRRSDIIRVGLMLLSTQEKLDDIQRVGLENAGACHKLMQLLTSSGHHAQCQHHFKL